MASRLAERPATGGPGRPPLRDADGTLAAKATSVGLAVRLTVLVGLSLLLVAMAAGYLGTRYQRKIILEATQRQAEYLTDVLAANAANALFTFNNSGLEALVLGFNLLKDVPALNADGSVNALVEIPAGTNAKWETSFETGRLFWELKKGKPRVVGYLGYPGNYGSVPRTLGGDGDPLDVICLGRMDLRGSVVPAKVVGVMFMVDDGDMDDKLVAVLPGTALYDKSWADLEAMGIAAILKTWFEYYKGPGIIQVTGFGDESAAAVILQEAIDRYLTVYP